MLSGVKLTFVFDRSDKKTHPVGMKYVRGAGAFSLCWITSIKIFWTLRSRAAPLLLLVLQIPVDHGPPETSILLLVEWWWDAKTRVGWDRL